MATPEQRIYTSLKKQLIGEHGAGRVFIQRVETSTGVGIPDVYVLCPSFHGWIETKTTAYKVSKEQYAWAMSYMDKGGHYAVVTMADDELVWLAMDVAMLDYASLGSYLKAKHGKEA
jgi:hypothetical protein